MVTDMVTEKETVVMVIITEIMTVLKMVMEMSLGITKEGGEDTDMDDGHGDGSTVLSNNTSENENDDNSIRFIGVSYCRYTLLKFHYKPTMCLSSLYTLIIVTLTEERQLTPVQCTLNMSEYVEGISSITYPYADALIPSISPAGPCTS